MNEFNDLLTTTLEKQRAYFRDGNTRCLSFRKQQLKILAGLLSENREDIQLALKKDLGRNDFESYFGEIDVVRQEVAFALENLAAWMRDDIVPTPPLHQPGKSLIVKEPYGITLILAPWNYPFQLAIAPLVGAIAGGNCCVIKPSEISTHTSSLLARLISGYFDPQYVAVIEGGVVETKAILEQPFDYIFFTGSTKFGRKVMEAAAQHLTPVTLELGGKSPCIVDRGVSLKRTARRICFGKFFNAGQTCIAPDYVMVHEDDREALIANLQEVIHEWYGDEVRQSPDYARIINAPHYHRLLNLMRDGRIVAGGVVDEESRFISPTILTDVDPRSGIMQEEIFGPLLPVLTYKNLEEAMDFINARPKPLALYLFTRKKKVWKKVIRYTTSGGVCINDTLSHLTTTGLPFGGVGASGMGSYHGKKTFDTFTHEKSVMKKSTFPDPSFRYPPYRKPSAFMRYLTRLLN